MDIVTNKDMIKSILDDTDKLVDFLIEPQRYGGSSLIYTSYFANMRRLGDRNYVSIARYTPKGIIMPSYLALAPTKDILFQYKRDNNKSVYINRYYEEVLKKLNPWKVAKELDGRTLLCYEKPGNFCHRFIVAEWLKFYGFDCREA